MLCGVRRAVWNLDGEEPLPNGHFFDEWLLWRPDPLWRKVLVGLRR
jgi:hypothetical protein